MKVVILAGGFGTRLSEETERQPKPLVKVGEYPILWHVIKHYEHYGIDEIVVALGYKGDDIKKYFMDYLNYRSNIRIDFINAEVTRDTRPPEHWKLEMIDTGLNSNTGDRVKSLQPWLDGETFMLTYGDGVSDVNLSDLLAHHKKMDRICTITAVRPPARFGGLVIEDHVVVEFTEKPQIGEGWINGGFMVFEPAVFQYIEEDDISLEMDVLEQLAIDGQLAAYEHNGFWQCVDTLRDLRLLNSLWDSGARPWVSWE